MSSVAAAACPLFPVGWLPASGVLAHLKWLFPCHCLHKARYYKLRTGHIIYKHGMNMNSFQYLAIDNFSHKGITG
jgi:hypothetical protein